MGVINLVRRKSLKRNEIEDGYNENTRSEKPCKVKKKKWPNKMGLIWKRKRDDEEDGEKEKVVKLS